MNSKVYRWCAVPQCANTSIKTPHKLFVFVPYKKSIRDKWLKLARRDSTGMLSSTHLYFCEDHFDLPNDMENYMVYHLMGSVSQIRMKPGCMPTKFHCQSHRRKRTSIATERPYILKRQRKILIEECEKDLEERTIATKQLELGATSSGTLKHQSIGTSELVVVKQEPEFQEDAPSLDSLETRQREDGSLMLPVKLETDTDVCNIKQEIDIGPTVLYKPSSFPASHESLDSLELQLDPVGGAAISL